MQSEYHYTRTPLVVALVFMSLVVIAEITAILRLNNGVFVYPLDDAYIHMALAENIRLGHYGVNATEFSAPCSSILWPFILAPLSSFEYFPLLLNTAFAILTVFMFLKILDLSLRMRDTRTRTIIVSALLLLLMLGVNTIGLIFTGMEHSLQLLLVTLVAWGLMVEAEKNRIEPWFLVAIVAGPLIRYENFAVSLAAIGYLFVRKYYKHAVSVLLLTIVLAGGFAFFLTRLGLYPLPTSVIAKLSAMGRTRALHAVLSNLRGTLSLAKGLLLSLGALGLLSYVCFGRSGGKQRQLAVITISAVAMHVFAGRYGWYNRYEIYIWAFFLLVSLYLMGGRITRLLESDDRSANLMKLLVVGCAFVFVTSPGYIAGLFTLPIGSNNVYEQQYQMHRFAVDYYKKAVAVNDLGRVSYKNNNYVLDLWGLASIDALEHRAKHHGSEWMSELVRSRDVELMMIYESSFQDLPHDWVKIGELHLGKKKVTPAHSEVAFYASNEGVYDDIVAKLQLFIRTLPDDVEFTFEERRE